MLASRTRVCRPVGVALASLMLAGQVAVPAAQAQTPRGGAQTRALSPEVQRAINSQQMLRVEGTWGSALVLRPVVGDRVLTFESLAAESPSLAADGQARQSLAMEEVSRITVRGNASRTGAAVGSAIGAVTGVAAGIGIARGGAGPGASFSTGGEVFGGGLAGAMVGCAVGGLLGAVIGSRFHEWHVIYARPR